MTLETILWTALVVVVSMAIGWILGIFYGISWMKSKEKSGGCPTYENPELMEKE